MYGASRFVAGPIKFSYDPATKQYWVLGTGGAVTGVNADVGTQEILGALQNASCYFSDWDTSGNTGNGDQNNNWSVIIINNTATRLTCTLRIDD